MVLTGQVRVTFESPDLHDVEMILRVDGISQEGTEEVTIRLEPSSEVNLPEGESVFFIYEINVAILDSDGKFSVWQLGIFCMS